MANLNYGYGGNQLDYNTLSNGVAAMMQGIYGDPQIALRNRQLQINEGNALQSAAKFGARQSLGDIVSQGFSKDQRGRIQIDPNAAAAAARADELPAYTGLVRGLNEPAAQDIENQTKLHLGIAGLSPGNFARQSYLANAGDPTAMRLSDEANAYGQTIDSQEIARKNALDVDKTRATRSIFDVNAGAVQAALHILNDPNITQESKTAQIDTILRFQKASGASADPELKAKAEVNKQRLLLETAVTPLPEGQKGIQQTEQDIKTSGNIAEILAKAAAEEKYLNRSTAVGAQQYDFREAGLSPSERLNFATNEKIREEKARIDEEIRKERAKREILTSGAPSPDTADGALIYQMKKAGATDQQIVAALQKPVVMPKGASVMMPPGSAFADGVRDASAPPPDDSALWRIPQIKQGMSPSDALKSMSKDEITTYFKNDPEAMIALRNATKPPAEGTLVRQGNILQRVSYKPVPEKVDSELTKLNDSLAQINQAIDVLSSDRAKGEFGWLIGARSMAPLGIGENLVASSIGRKGVQDRAVLFDPVSQRKHELYGAALTGGERIDANQFLPTAFANSEAALGKMIQFRDKVASVIENRLNTYNPQHGFNMPTDSERAMELIQPFTRERAKGKNNPKEGK